MSENLFVSQVSSNSQKEKIEAKFQNRYDLLFAEKKFSEIKDDSMNNELSLRKTFREEIFIQKRLKQRMIEQNGNSSPKKIINKLTISQELYNECNLMNVNIQQLKDILIYFNSDNIEQKYKGLVGIRKILCLQNPPTQLLLEMNILPSLIQLLDNTPIEFQYESLWCLINISVVENNGQKIKYLGGIDKIISKLDSSMNEIKDLALWNIENLCYESPKIVIYFIQKKLLNKLITLLSVNNNINLVVRSISIVRTLIKSCNKKNVDNINYINDLKRVINIVSRIIMANRYQPEKKEIRDLYYDSLYIFSYLTDNSVKCRDALLTSGVLHYIIELIKIFNEQDDLFLILGGLKIIGNIIIGNANQTQKVLDCNIYDILKVLMFRENKRIKKEANWIVSNIAAGTEKNIIDLIDNGFFPLLCQIFQKEEKEIKAEAIWTLCNFSQIKNNDYIKILIEQGLLLIVCECLKSEESKEIAISLEALNNLLEYGQRISFDGNNIIALEIEKIGMINALENLQYHPNEIIYEKTLNTIEKYFLTE